MMFLFALPVGGSINSDTLFGRSKVHMEAKKWLLPKASSLVILEVLNLKEAKLMLVVATSCMSVPISTVSSFSAMADGRSEEMSTKELTGGARIHHIFQSIFVKSLEEVDPCKDLTDDDIRTAIQNATGLRNALFVPEVPFEVLVKRQIAWLLDPSLQCLRFVYDELIRMSRACEATEIQRFPMLRRNLDEVVGTFLRDSVKPAERMIKDLIEMEMDYINSSHPNFLGGNKAVEVAMQQVRSSQGSHPQTNNDRPVSNGISSARTWGISSKLWSRSASGQSSANGSSCETVNDIEQIPSMIQLREPPFILRPAETQTEQEAVEIMVTKLLLRSYYDIVRKNIQDLVPKVIMHFVVNHTKRGLLSIFIQKLYRENLFEEMFREEDEVAITRKRTREMVHVLEQAIQTLEGVEADVSCQKFTVGY